MKNKAIEYTRNYYNHVARSRSQNERLSWSYFEYQYLLKDLLKRLKSSARMNRLLDFGCAEGKELDRFLYYKKFNYKYSGVDISENLIEIARKNKPDCDFRVIDGENIPFSSDYFDFVVCFGVLQYVTDRDNMIKELKKTLKEGGFVYIREPMWIKEGAGTTTPYERGVSYKELSALLNKNNMRIIKKRFSHNTALFRLLSALNYFGLYSNLMFWRHIFIFDYLINKLLTNRLVPVGFYRWFKIRPSTLNVIAVKRCVKNNEKEHKISHVNL